MRDRKGPCRVAIGTAVLVSAMAARAADPPPPAVQLSESCAPRYPDAALSARAGGTSELVLHVDATGAVEQVDVMKSAGPTPVHALLDRTVAEAVIKCRSRPLFLGGDASGPGLFAMTYAWDPDRPGDRSQAASMLVRDPACRPTYPVAALRLGAQGVTQVALHITASGKVAAADIVQASGATRAHALLDRAAADAMAKCPVRPALDKQGNPVDSVITVTYTWTMD